MFYPMGRPPTKWGAFARIPERRPGEHHYGDRVINDSNTEISENLLRTDFDRYFALSARDVDPMVSIKNQHEVTKFLIGWEKAYQQVFALFQQFGSEEVFFRVIGSKSADPELFKKGPIDEQFDYRLTFDVVSTDLEQMQIKWKAILDGIQMLNREGNVNFAETLQAYVEGIDPNIAERILEPAEVGRQKIMEQEQEDLTQIYAGFNKNIRLGTPPQIAMEVIKVFMQSPDVQERYQRDQSFRERLDARWAQYVQQTKQEENRLIGVLGAKMPGPTLT
jgi:hypothetical protein